MHANLQRASTSRCARRLPLTNHPTKKKFILANSGQGQPFIREIVRNIVHVSQPAKAGLATYKKHWNNIMNT